MQTCFSAVSSQPLLPVPLPHVNVSAAGLRESLPTDPAHVRLLTWEAGRRFKVMPSLSPFAARKTSEGLHGETTVASLTRVYEHVFP